MGVPMEDNDVSFRTNLVTLSEAANYEDRIMLDHSSDEISTQEAAQLIEEVKNTLKMTFLPFILGSATGTAFFGKMAPPILT